MLSYLHAYHAGNFADIHKHMALLQAVSLMQKKDTPIAFFDTHAGSASYLLNSQEALKTGEASEAIIPLWARRQDLTDPAWSAFFQHLVFATEGPAAQWPATGKKPLIHYPGSPAWLQALRRPQDRLTVFELHPQEQNRLADWARGRSVSVQTGDGFAGLLRCLPPREPRLLALIDPAYEVKTDYLTVADTLAQAIKRCRHGVYLIWHPILSDERHIPLLDAVAALGLPSLVHSEWLRGDSSGAPAGRGRMLGSGLLLVNPPWTWQPVFDAAMQAASLALKSVSPLTHRLNEIQKSHLRLTTDLRDT